MNNYPELIRRVKKLNHPGHRLNNTDTATLSIAVGAIAALEAEKENLIQALELSGVSQKEMADSFKETNAWQEIGRLTEELAALEAENAKLRDPWVRIDPERPETLPQEKEGFFMSNFVLVTFFDSRINKSYVEKARYDYDYPKSPDSPYGWREDDGYLLDSPYLTAIAWRSLPEPAVYEESE